jgi:endonuclease/exonuclease/phosphatase family metal-dependent hydrolase
MKLRALVLLLVACSCSADTNTFTIATYNLQNWVLMERKGTANAPKPASEQKAVVNVLAVVKPDVLAVQEMGTTKELAELRRALKDRGLDYPHTEWIQGDDPTRHVALLSRFPIVERSSHTNDTYQLDGQPKRISRGILDARVQVNPQYSFRVLVVHLKSKRQTDGGDQAVMRREEARLVRRHVEEIFKADPNENFIVTGDFNDSYSSDAIREVSGTNSHRLVVLRPRDSKGYDTTHFWKARREFSRLDYLMLSPGMRSELVTGTPRIADPPRWLDGSDHRAVSATFYMQERGTNHPARAKAR